MLSGIPQLTYNVDGSIYLDALSEQEERRSVDYTGMDGVSDSGSVMVARRGAELVSDTEDDYELSLPPCDYIRQLKSSDQLRDLALLISCTLASVPDGCHANKLRALFHNDWGTTVDDAVQACGYPSFDTFLESEYMKDYVEVKNITNNSIIYAVKVTPSIQHITQTLADQNLNADQIKMKRKRQRLLELKKVENTEAFIEEQSRMFTSKAALKNIRRVFYNEIDIISQNPLMIKLKSSNVKIPEEISEEDRLRAVGIEDVELPSFSMYDSNADEKSNRQRMF
ncbi:unnamed protein product [Anisakis simplex]|uniref:WHIM1 domain-containing protein n=1 Tax=Anisakis simplex TaxID=6269 RepID=A0A0M3K3P9_ANISI|nr:unnamed protein product [Anisakis simplex]